MGHYYRFKRGDDLVTIISGLYTGHISAVDSAVFQRTVDYPADHTPGYHVVLDTDAVAIGHSDQAYIAGSSSMQSPNTTQGCRLGVGLRIRC